MQHQLHWISRKVHQRPQTRNRHVDIAVADQTADGGNTVLLNRYVSRHALADAGGVAFLTTIPTMLLPIHHSVLSSTP